MEAIRAPARRQAKVQGVHCGSRDSSGCEGQRKQGYANKIKNRLDKMGKITRAYNTEMGETGAGIHDAQSIDMTAISAKCPWYFEMRNLIGQRPNLVPTGIGHSNTAVDDGVIIPGPVLTLPVIPQLREFSGGNTGSDFEIEDDGAAAGSGDDYEPTPVHSESGLVEPSGCEVVVGGDEEESEVDTLEVKAKVKKAKEEKGSETHQKRRARPTTSNPAAPAPPSAPKPSKKTKMGDFSDILKAEERTRQKEIDLATL
ncbi:hypothetical protein B0H13DRAFT_2327364 [Mycena leptocephala]|nr:hypothetical protein B0H13DRAFT_2327364 [Mycena leptocephala]